MMISKFATGLFCWLILCTSSWAISWEVGLNAGANSVEGGVHHQYYIETGFLRIGGTGLYLDTDDNEHLWGTLDFTVGTDVLSPGLTCEVGIRGIYGIGEEDSMKGDIGAVGFTGAAGYVFSRQLIPIPLEINSRLTYAPESLSFLDTRSFLEFSIGAGVRLARNASIMLSYTIYQVEMDSGDDDWDMNNDEFRIGLIMRF